MTILSSLLLYAKMPDIKYRQRYEELTSDHLPEPPPLPELPEMLQQSSIDLEGLLEQIDQAIDDLQTARA